MRIAILADFPLSSLESGATGRGGGQGCTWLPQLAESFEKYPEFEIHWVILDRKRLGPATFKAHGQTYHRIKGVSISLDVALANRPTRLAIKSFLKKIKPDIVHAWGTELIYPSALQDFNGPTVLSMQGVLTEYQRIGGLPNDWRWSRMVAREPAMIRSATVVTCESEWGISKLKQIAPEENYRLVEYGVHPRFFELPWQPDPQLPYMIYVGGSGPRKGFDALIEAIKRVPNRKWQLRLAGDSAMQTAANELPHVECLGLLPWEQMQIQLQKAWCFILPTRGDTSPNSVKEARVIGLPVITTRHGGQAGYIKDGENGRIVDPENPEALAEAMMDVMSSFERAMQMGKTRHDIDRAYLDPRHTAAGFAAIYRELAGKF